MKNTQANYNRQRYSVVCAKGKLGPYTITEAKRYANSISQWDGHATIENEFGRWMLLYQDGAIVARNTEAPALLTGK